MSKRFELQLLSFLAAALCATVVCFAEDARVGAPSVARVVVKNQGFLPFAYAPINYRSQDLNDPIAKLQKRLHRGEVALHYESRYGYLKAVLSALQIPVSSQTLVFSKTSFQFPEITPEAPRALYYNDDVYVGRVHNGKFL